MRPSLIAGVEFLERTPVTVLNDKVYDATRLVYCPQTMTEMVDYTQRFDLTFDSQTLDTNKWFQPKPSRGTQPPRIDKGMLVYDDEKMYPLTSYATFNDLLKYEGKDRYRLRFHATTLPNAPTNETTVTLGIQAGTGSLSSKVTGMFFYHCFRAKPAISCLPSPFTSIPSVSIRRH